MECFVVNSNELVGTLGVEYYKPILQSNKNRIKTSLYKFEKLETLCEIITKGETPLWRGDSYQKEGILFIKSENVLKNELVVNNSVYISDSVHERVKRSQLKYGDVLLNIVGASIGRSCVFNLKREGNINQAVCLIRLKNSFNPFWLSYLLNSNFFQLIIKQNQSGGARDNIDLYQVRELLVPIHAKNIQDKIVALMDNAYSIKKSKEAEARKLLDSINDYVLDELGIKLPELKDKMVYVVNSEEVENKRIDAYYYQPKFEEVEKAIKKGKFEVKELKEFITKIHYGASVKNEYVDEGIPLLRIMNLKPNKFDLRDVVRLPETMKKELGNAFVSESDLLISRSGTVGVVSVVPKEAEGFAFGSFMIKFCLSEKVNKNYVSAWLNTRLQKLLTEREKIGAIQGNITIGTIESFIIPLPPLAVQNKIAEEVKSRMQKAEQLQKEAKEELEKAKQEVEKIILGENES